jgi:hypothetical protein
MKKNIDHLVIYDYIVIGININKKIIWIFHQKKCFLK